MLADLLADARTEFVGAPEDALGLLTVGSVPIPDRRDPVELAAWSVVTGTILASDAAVVLR